MNEEFFIFLGIGLLSGFFSGMVGIGGGSIKIPLLSLTGMPLINAFATNMFAIPFSSITGAIIQRKNIDFKVAKIFTIGGVFGIVIATFLVGFFSSSILALLFFFAAIVTVIGIYLDSISEKIYKKIRPTKTNLFLGPFLGNFIIGLRGGSGGTLFPPILKAMHVKMHKAVATSLYAGIFSSLAALIIYFFRGHILFVPGLILGFGAFVGSFIGSKISLKTGSKTLKICLAFLVIFFAFVVLYREFF